MKETASKQPVAKSHHAPPKAENRPQPNLEAVVQAARERSAALSQGAVLQLQRAIGNRAVMERMTRTVSAPIAARQIAPAVQRDDTTRTAISETTDTGNKYTQDLIHNKTQSTLTVSLGINWVKTGTWANDAAYQQFIRRVKTAAYGYLDNKFKVQCVPQKTDTGLTTINLPIDFLIYDSR